MKKTNTPLTAQDQFGRRIAAHLDACTREVPHDISERLRIARLGALRQLQQTQIKTAATTQRSGASATLSFGDDAGTPWWGRIAAVLPLILLVVGLLALNVLQKEFRAEELAEIDSALLTDDLPPAAYTDPGFAQFLHARQDRNP